MSKQIKIGRESYTLPFKAYEDLAGYKEIVDEFYRPVAEAPAMSMARHIADALNYYADKERHDAELAELRAETGARILRAVSQRLSDSVERAGDVGCDDLVEWYFGGLDALRYSYATRQSD